MVTPAKKKKNNETNNETTTVTPPTTTPTTTPTTEAPPNVIALDPEMMQAYKTLLASMSKEELMQRASAVRIKGVLMNAHNMIIEALSSVGVEGSAKDPLTLVIYNNKHEYIIESDGSYEPVEEDCYDEDEEDEDEDDEDEDESASDDEDEEDEEDEDEDESDDEDEDEDEKPKRKRASKRKAKGKVGRPKAVNGKAAKPAAIIRATKEMMEEHELSQADIAKKMKVSQATVSNWINKKMKPEGKHAVALTKLVSNYL